MGTFSLMLYGGVAAGVLVVVLAIYLAGRRAGLAKARKEKLDAYERALDDIESAQDARTRAERDFDKRVRDGGAA